ncbi:MAG TPA: Gmad2 immunoglobulin-like domain-containing protein [Chitinophagaceae bacterium]|nr:Gmad2 immunoglobulin-like domain-containing protein [Chitinophagaceae bacterium]
MNNNSKNYIIVALLAVVAILALIYIPRRDNNDNADDQDLTQITNFLTCSEAGYPVLETFPAQCRTPDGRTFVEDTNEHVDVVLSTPVRDGLVTSPLTVSGKARGNWFFEANLPVTLKDANGKILAQKGAQAEGEWMTTDFVNFTTVLEFSAPTTDTGILLVEKDNPSGLPEHAGSYAIPVRFK